MPHHSQLKGGLFGDEQIYVERCSFRDALRLVKCFHRHHGRVAGHKFSLMANLINNIRIAEAGVVIVGRPVSRHLDDGKTLEITRLATRSIPNVASKLLAAAAKMARQMGYARIITYTLQEESGTSLRAAGFTLEATTRGGSWNTTSRPRIDRHPTGKKHRWVRHLSRCAEPPAKTP